MAEGSVTDEQAHIWLQQIADSGWVSLHYDNPGLAGEDRAECSGAGYTRFRMSWSQPVNRHIWSAVDAEFNGLNQTNVTFFGVWDLQYKGYLRAYTELPEPVVILQGKGYLLPKGMVALSFG